jgi:hypothetical protein
LQKAWNSTAAVAATTPQIPVDFEHGRLREARQIKEDDEGIPFRTLLTAETHRGDRILRRKSQRLFCSSVLGGWHLFLFQVVLVYGKGATGGERTVAGEGRSRGGAGGEGTHGMQAMQGSSGGCVAETQEDAGRG